MGFRRLVVGSSIYVAAWYSAMVATLNVLEGQYRYTVAIVVSWWISIYVHRVFGTFDIRGLVLWVVLVGLLLLIGDTGWLLMYGRTLRGSDFEQAGAEFEVIGFGVWSVLFLSPAVTDRLVDWGLTRLRKWNEATSETK